jgi:hypothetical protein
LKNPDAKKDMKGKLGTAMSRIKDEVRPDAEELLEPPLDQPASAASAGTGKPAGGTRSPPGKRAPAPSDQTGSKTPGGRDDRVIVQMSHDWIVQNLTGAVGAVLSRTIESLGYERHILYVPFYLPSAVAHETAVITGDEKGHKDHTLPPTHHYNDAEVDSAVKRKTATLKKKTS